MAVLYNCCILFGSKILKKIIKFNAFRFRFLFTYFQFFNIRILNERRKLQHVMTMMIILDQLYLVTAILILHCIISKLNLNMQIDDYMYSE